MSKNNLKIGIIGLGNLAHSFANALLNAGYYLGYVKDIDNEAVRQFEEKYNLRLDDNIDEIGLFFLTVPDDSIMTASEQLCNKLKNFEGKCFVHTSGSKNINALQPIIKKGGNVGSFHIMQTFPEKNNVSLKNCFAAIETGNEFVKQKLTDIAKDLEMTPVYLNSEQKTLYHLLGVVSSNFLVGNLYAVEKIGGKLGFSKEDSLKIVSNLIFSTLKNVFKNGSRKSLSGPVARGDISTIKEHLTSLESDKELSNYYKSVSNLLLGISNINSDKIEKLKELLSDKY